MRGRIGVLRSAMLLVGIGAVLTVGLSACGVSGATGQEAASTPSPTATAIPSPTPSLTPTATGSSVAGTWHIVASPDKGGQLNGIVAVSASDLWAVGMVATNTGSATLIEHYNGSRWSIVPGASLSATQSSVLNGVAAIAANDVWVVGYSGTKTLTEHWNGSAWSVVASPNQGTMGSRLNGIVALSSNDVWAVGYYVTGQSCGSVDQPLIEHWNGATWSIAASPKSTSPYGALLNAVSATSASDIWAVGNVGLIEHYNGSTWSVVTAPSGTYLLGVAAFSAGNAWAVGMAPNGDGPYTARWNGTKWSAVSTPQGQLDQSELVGISGVNSNDIWAVGGNPPMGCSGGSHPLVEHWNGSSWSIVASADLKSLSYGFFEAVVAVSAHNVWAVGQQAAGQMGSDSGSQRSLIAHYTS